MGKKIVHITFSDKVGGAAVAAYRLHKLMLNNGIDSRMVVFEKLRKDERISTVFNSGLDIYIKKIKIYFWGVKSFSLNNKYGHYSTFSLGGNIRNNKIINEAEVIYLHWVNSGLINFKDIEYLLKKNKKVIWIMHDMFPITGGCHHSFDCEGYKGKCNCCHFFDNSNKPIYQLNQKSKLKNYNNMYWVAPSKWLFDKASSSIAVEKKRLYYIPNAISDNFFHLDKSFSKEALGLESQYNYILYGANNLLNNPYKGYEFLPQVIDSIISNVDEIELRNIKLLLFGLTENESLKNIIKIPIVFMGDILDECAMNLLYNASSILLMTSVAENAPLVIQECKACGTPIVAFDVGGIPEMINNKNEGVVLKKGDVAEMASAVIDILRYNIADNVSIMNLDTNKFVISEHINLINE